MSATKVWATTENGKIQYISLSKEYLKDAIELLKTAFFPHENICKALGIAKKPESLEEADDMVIKTAKDGVSVIAIDRDTDKLVGVTLNKLQDKNTSSKEYYGEHIKKAKYEESRSLFEFLYKMEDSVDPFTPYDANCLLELVFLGVSGDYSRRGIGLKLCEVSMELATQLFKGNNVKVPLDDVKLPLEPRPQIVTAIFTSFKTQKIGRKLNFDILKTISYDDLFHNGRPYSSFIDDETKGFTIECKKLK